MKDKIVNIIFCIVLIICAISLLLSFMVFAINLTSTSEAIKNTSNSIIHLLSNYTTSDNSNSLIISEGIGRDENDTDEQENLYLQNSIDYLERLKEIESSSVSVNLLTFLYTFLSSVLLGVGTFYMKKNVENTNLIQKSRELIEKNNSEIIEINKLVTSSRIEVNNSIEFSNLCIKLQKVLISASNISSIVDFYKKLSETQTESQNNNFYSKLLGISLAQLNEAT